MSASSLGSIPDKANIQHIHSLRNDAQHRAKYPDYGDRYHWPCSSPEPAFNYSDYYREIAGYIYFTMDGKHHHDGIKQPLNANDSEFVVSYYIDTVAQIEWEIEECGFIGIPFHNAVK